MNSGVESKISISDSVNNIVDLPQGPRLKLDKSVSRLTPDGDSSGREGEGGRLDIEKYLDKADQDRRDSESRIHQERVELESRMDRRQDQLIQDRRESEARIDTRINQVVQAMEKTNEKLDSATKEMSAKLDKAIKAIDEKGTQTTRWVMGMALSIVLAVAGLAYTVINFMINYAAKTP